jgi:protease-4
MSENNKTQVSSYLGSIYSGYIRNIAKSRSINIDSLFSISNNLKVTDASGALNYHLVNGLKYRDEVLEELRVLSHVKVIKDIPLVTLSEYNENISPSESHSDSKISIIFASGDINGGEGNNKSIGSEGLSKTIREARLNKDIKAIVLRVNSPGGSALASDIIWREVFLTKKVKPIIVSMGDVAASGGYYISCAANKIFAQPNTITGSIGIFGIIPNAQKFFNEKLGITFDGVKTGKFADILTVTRPLGEDEKQIIQSQVNRGYQSFLDRVSQGRAKTKAEIDSISQGRVWTGEQALKIGLVDRLGGLDDAIKEAAKEAKLKSYSVSYETYEKKLTESLFSGAMDKIKLDLLENELGQNKRYFNILKTIQSWSGIQARLPLDFQNQ